MTTQKNTTVADGTKVVGGRVQRVSGRDVPYYLTRISYDAEVRITIAVRDDPEFKVLERPTWKRWIGPESDGENREYEERAFTQPPTLENKWPEEDVNRWNEYQESHEKAQAEINKRLGLLMVFDGIHFDIPEDKAADSDEYHEASGKPWPKWAIEDRDVRGYPLPEDATEPMLKAEYLQRHVVGSESELRTIQSVIHAMSQGFMFEDGNTAAEISAMFRSLGQKNWQALVRVALSNRVQRTGSMGI